MDIFDIIKLVFALIEDTELRNNPAFRTANLIVKGVSTGELSSGAVLPADNSGRLTLDSELHADRRDA